MVELVGPGVSGFGL